MATGHVNQTSMRRVFVPLVWLAAVQMLFFSLLASSPSLHEFAHGHADGADHHCLATDLQDGAVEGLVILAPWMPGIAPLATLAVAIPSLETNSLPAHLAGSLLEHGPPGRV